MRKVKYSFILVGKTAKKKIKDNGHFYTNAELLELVKEDVRNQFGDRATFVVNAPSISNDVNKYPNFYAATWLVSDDPVDGDVGVGSELVLIDHANTMEAARKSLFDTVKSIEWDTLASTIQ